MAAGEFYLVRAGNTRKGIGTFYTRPQLAVRKYLEDQPEKPDHTTADDGPFTLQNRLPKPQQRLF